MKKTASKSAKKTSAAKKTTVKKAVKSPAKAAATLRMASNSIGTGMRPTAFAELLTGSKPNQAMESIMAQGKTNMDKMTQDAAVMGREGMDALMKSGTTLAKGYENILRTMMSLAQNSVEKQSKYVKEALGAKTLNEWTEISNKIAQSNFDDFMSGTTKITEMSVKVMSEVTEPLNNQMTKVNNQMSKGLKKATDLAA